MGTQHNTRLAQRFVAAVGVVFGIVTLFAGGRVLGGFDPGYIVFRPLLLYNTTMGLAYIVAGIAIWRSIRTGSYAAATIFMLNLIVLVSILAIHRAGGAVALESLRAMGFRTTVWLALFLITWWIRRAQSVD